MESKAKLQNEKKHPYTLLLIGLILLGGFLYLIFSLPPTYLIPLGSLQFSIIIPALALLFCIIYAMAAFFFISAVQGVVFAAGLLAYLILLYFQLTQWIFLLLLLGIFASIEFAIYKKK